MTSFSTTTPTVLGPLERFVHGWQEMSTHRRWFTDLATRRFATAIALTGCASASIPPAELVDRTIRAAAILRTESRALSCLGNDSRWAVAASLVARDLEPDGFAARLREVRTELRNAGVPRDEMREASATVEVLEAMRTSGSTLGRCVAEFVAAHGATRSIHGAILPHTEYGLTAVVARQWRAPLRDLSDDARRVFAEISEPYSFGKHGLRMAAQIATIGVASVQEFPARFRRITSELTRLGLRMNSRDHADVGLLAASEGAPDELASELVNVRDELRMAVHPRVAKQEAFHLSAALVASSRGMRAPIAPVLTTTWQHDWQARHAG